MRMLPLAMAVLGATVVATAHAQQNTTQHSTQNTAAACRPGTPVAPADLLERSLKTMGVRNAGDNVLYFRARESAAAREQSDKWYPPYLQSVTERKVWFDPRTGAERHDFDLVWPGQNRSGSLLFGPVSVYVVQDTLVRPSSYAFNRQFRLLDPWAVVLEWRHDSTVRYRQECTYRDARTAVFERPGIDGPERLFIDARSALPVKLDYDEPHYLWGQIRVEYLYLTWITPRGGGSYPGSAARLEDGETVVNRTTSGPDIALIPGDSAKRMALPPNATDMRQKGTTIFGGAADRPDTVRVSAATFLLVTRAYTETVTLQKDTVYLLDATTGEARSRQDSTWIAALFPGRHPMVVVVTDLAWPHIAGVRFWIARGATIVTHAGSVDFLRTASAHAWTLAPDALEQSRAPRGAQLRARTLTDSLSLAGGAIKVYAIDGGSTGSALMAFVTPDRYLWASDFVQRLDQPSQYASDVWSAVRRLGLAPDRFAAEHVGLTPIAALQRIGH